MSGRVQTVLGAVSPDVLGRTLTHEHLSMEFTHFYRRPPAALASKFPAKHISLQSVGYLRQYPYSSKYNLTLNDKDTVQAVLNDVKMFKESGGGTIVENSAEGLDRDLSFLKRVSTETGVHVVAGTGYYIADTQHDDSLHRTTEEMYKRMMADLTEGCVEDKTIKAGFIGEVASVWPIREFERRAIVATGEVVEQLGVGVSFHPHRNPDAPAEIIRIYLEAGGRADRAVMSHLDRGVRRARLLAHPQQRDAAHEVPRLHSTRYRPRHHTEPREVARHTELILIFAILPISQQLKQYPVPPRASRPVAKGRLSCSCLTRDTSHV
ncbi:phosphotriesterase-related protein isoform X2 [Cydia strobilella]|uniref:phosphotriesterase-related protein isoform X2 n=1 Tax=Cydia strobilella TaxID=1100964 RepID=UPI003004BCAF